MDYDDNDFQSQNFQLVGEDNNRFPSSLRSFALPKLDLDEHFGAHLRFDTLVESDSLLGIQSHDSNWIENFSSGSTLEFTSRAAESCSIARQNNVWSEATSSESVEMLLKSVGEDEMKNEVSIIEELDACDRLIELEDQKSYSKMENIIDIDPALPPDKCPESSSGMTDNSTGAHSLVDGMPQPSKGEKSVINSEFGSSGERFSSDQESGAEQCTIDWEKTASSHDSPKILPVLVGDSFESAQKEDHVCSVVEKIAYDDQLSGGNLHRKRSDPDTCSAQVNACAASTSSLVGTQNHGLLVSSGDVMERQNDSALIEKEAPIDDDSLKNKPDDAKFNNQHYEGGAVDSVSFMAKGHTSEPNMDSSGMLTGECSDALFSGNPDGLLEAIAYPLKGRIKGGKNGDETTTGAENTSCLAAEGDRNELNVETNNEENVDNCYRREGSAVHGPSAHSPTDGPHSEDSLHAENTEAVVEHPEKDKIDASKELTEGKNGPEYVQTDNNSSHMDNTSREAVELQNSHDQACTTRRTKTKESVGLATDLSLPNPLSISSADSGKHAQVVAAEEESTVDPAETVIQEKSSVTQEKSSSFALVDVAHRAFEIGGVDNLVPESSPHEASAGFTGPSISPGSSRPDAAAAVVLKKMKPVSSVPDTAMLAVMDDSKIADKKESEQNKPGSSLPAYSDEQEMNTSGSSSPMLSSNPEGHILSKSVSETGVADALAGKETSQGVSDVAAKTPIVDGKLESSKKETHCSHPEDNIDLETKQIMSSVTKSSFIQLDEKNVTCTRISTGDVNAEAIATTEAHYSGPSSPTMCENRERIKANVVLGDGNSSQNVTQQSESTAIYHSLETRNGNSGCSEGNSGSPVAIPCTKGSKEMELHRRTKGLSDQTNTGADDQTWNASDTLRSTDKVEPVSDDSQNIAATESDRIFTFEVGPLTESTGKEWKPFPSMQSFELPQMFKEHSQGRHFESEEGKLNGLSMKTADTDKTPVSGNENATSSGKPQEEAPSPVQTTRRDKKPSSTSPGTVGTSRGDLLSQEMRHPPSIQNGITKASYCPAIQPSGLPDLNSSISAAALSHQPFTNLQQVQLRAQIFVYGSVIQGIPPDETCMVSAFGEVDNGHSSWEAVWRIAVERFQTQKSPLSSCETPLPSRSGVRNPEQVIRYNSHQSKTQSPSVSVTGTKVGPSSALNSPSFPTPLWSISAHDNLHTNVPRGTNLDFNQAATPLHSYQLSQMRQYPGNSASWFSACTHPVPLVVPSQSSRFDTTPQYSTVPVVASQVTPSRESPLSRASNMQLGTSSALVSSPGPLTQIESHKENATPGNNKNPSNVPKSRKRKKPAVPEGLGVVYPVSQPLTEPSAVTITSKNITFSAGLPSSVNSPAKVGSSGPVITVSRITSPTNYQIISSGNTEQRVIFSEEIHSKLDQAKVQAEDAAALAASAVRHSQGIWNQLTLQMNTGLASEVEGKFASAAAAAAAAASVANAAAAAAKVASDAALQAKFMADEALDSSRTQINTKSYGTDLVMGKNLAGLSPVSILKGKDACYGSNSVISAAREASRRRVEAASAAAKRAENLDAIVKAAELTAEAVSQAGIIVAMGDPLPFTLSELAEAGPENYWKLHQKATNMVIKPNAQIIAAEPGTNNLQSREVTDNENNGCSNHDGTQKISDGDDKSSHKELLVPPENNYTGAGMRDASSGDPTIRCEGNAFRSDLMDNIIQKDSLVEVVPDEDGLRGVWFSARVLDLKDGKAYVCFNNLLTDKGSGQLKEWVPLEIDGNKPPRIRIAHPMTAMKSEVAKKRCREAMGNYVWTVGDHVDAWMRDGWWEGIVTEKSKDDETKLTVHFPAGGDTLIISGWNLRPSLVWKDGQWAQWSHDRENILEPYEHDTPNEKRPKLSSSEVTLDSGVDEKGNGKMLRSSTLEALRKSEESRPLTLSARERVFSVGKNVREENNSGALKTARTGVQKEGSRVVFGVPKPGKKRKFMEVSKHYVADNMNKISEGNDCIKLAKYLMPQASRSIRNTPKVDPRGKRAVDSKTKWPKPVRPQINQTRSTAEKDNSSVSNTCASFGEDSGQGASSNPRSSLNDEENQIEKTNMAEGGTDIQSAELYSQPVSGINPSRSSASEANLGVKQKLNTAVEKSSRSEVKGLDHSEKTVSEASMEPRRSNRRIQPTSRLLEGLQSSLFISKIPTVSHDRGSRSLHRGSSSSKGGTHG